MIQKDIYTLGNILMSYHKIVTEEVLEEEPVPIVRVTLQSCGSKNFEENEIKSTLVVDIANPSNNFYQDLMQNGIFIGGTII